MAGIRKMLVGSLSSVHLTERVSPPALASTSPQVIIAGIAAVVLSRYLPSTPLVCVASSDGTVGWVSGPLVAKH